MPTDLIVEEIRVIREALSKASGDDIRKIAEAVRARQMQSGRKLEGYLNPNGNLDLALENLARLDISSLDLAPFELELLRDAQYSLPN
jgi:hypothetical protein